MFVVNTFYLRQIHNSACILCSYKSCPGLIIQGSPIIYRIRMLMISKSNRDILYFPTLNNLNIQVGIYTISAEHIRFIVVVLFNANIAKFITVLK